MMSDEGALVAAQMTVYAFDTNGDLKLNKTEFAEAF